MPTRAILSGLFVTTFPSQIRRRQRKEFVSKNAEQGLYFTPRLYDGFMALLQRAKTIALAAEAGTYDVDSSSNKSDENNVLMHDHAQGAEAGECTGQDGLEALPPSTAQERSNSIGVIKGGGSSGGEKDSDRSECSTRPVSAQSSSGSSEGSVGGGGGDSDHNDREDEDRTLKARNQGTVAVESEHTKRRGHSTAGEGMEIKARQIEEDLTIAAADTGQESVEEIREREEDDGGNGREGEDQARRAEALLRGMLESLNCAEWDGAVSTVLDAIEDLTRWVPTTPLLPPLPPADGTDLEGARRSSAAEGALAGSGGALTAVGDDDDRIRGAQAGEEERIGGAGTRDSKDAEEEEDEDDEEEEEEEAEEEDDEDAEEEGEDEDDGSEHEDETDEDEEAEQLHPVLTEQNALRAQWRRLLLDAQLEPETDCTMLMREAVESMVRDVAGVMEGVRREAAPSGAATAGGKSTAAAAAAAGGEAQTPRAGVLGYDEVMSFSLACLNERTKFLSTEGQRVTFVNKKHPRLSSLGMLE